MLCFVQNKNKIVMELKISAAFKTVLLSKQAEKENAQGEI